jgi:hypothetical protein
VRQLHLALVLVASVVSACGSSKPSPQSAKASKAEKPPEPEAKAEGSEPAEPTAAKIPTACASESDGVCSMPKAFISRLCAATYPNLALVLFGHGTPWTHGYLTRKTQAWNAEGGASVQDFLEFDEEVLILAARMPPKGGMQVSGAGGYQAFRWSGSCVTLASEEVTMKRPPSPKHPRIEWKYLEDGMRDALRKDSKVDGAASALKRECHGVSSGDVSKKCVEADGKIGDAIVEYVEDTGTLPEPAKLP